MNEKQKHAIDVLMHHRVEIADEHDIPAINYLVNKLKPDELDALLKAISSNGLDSPKCITIPLPSDGQKIIIIIKKIWLCQ